MLIANCKLYRTVLPLFKVLLAILLAVCLMGLANAQEVLLEKDVVADTDKLNQTKGPNKTNFGCFYTGAGSILPIDESTGATILTPSFSFYQLGYRYKRKFNSVYAAGLDFSYVLHSYRLAQVPGKLLPNNITHHREQLRFNAFSMEAYQRINFDKNRGDHLGLFLDVGVFVSADFRVKYYAKDIQYNSAARGDVTVVSVTKLDYVNYFHTGMRYRIGYRKYTLMFEYRLTDLIKESSNLPALPKFTAAFAISLY